MFQVVWLQSALNELAAIWTQADSALRQTITATTHLIDQELQNDPEQKGESRAAGKRVLYALPLGVQFAIDRQRRIVRVAHVWHVRRRK